MGERDKGGREGGKGEREGETREGRREGMGGRDEGGREGGSEGGKERQSEGEKKAEEIQKREKEDVDNNRSSPCHYNSYETYWSNADTSISHGPSSLPLPNSPPSNSPLLSPLEWEVLMVSLNTLTGRRVSGLAEEFLPFCTASSIHRICFHACSVLS